LFFQVHGESPVQEIAQFKGVLLPRHDEREEVISFRVCGESLMSIKYRTGTSCEDGAQLNQPGYENGYSDESQAFRHRYHAGIIAPAEHQPFKEFS
jgi:hypothetical protein